MTKNLFIHSFSALAALCLTHAALAAVPPAEKLLPSDTLAMFTVPDSAALRAVSAKSPASLLLNDPAMRPIKEKFLKQLNEELLTPLERELGVQLTNYVALAQGQFTLALTQNGWQGNPGEQAGALLLVDARDQRDTLKKSLAEFRTKWTDAGKTVRTEKIRGTEFLIVTLTSNDVPATLKRLLPGPSGVRELGDEEEETDEDAPKPVKKSELVLGQIESLFIVGNTVSAVERVAGQLGDSSAAALAEVAHFQSSQSEFFRNAHAYGWVNARQAMDALTKLSERKEKASAEAPDPFATLRPEKILSAAGLSGLRSAAFAYQEAPDGALVQFHLAVPESERKGLLKILAGEPRETTPPPFVPADAVEFQRWRMDGQKTWSTLTSALNEISPTIMSSMDFILGTADAAGKQMDEKFDLKRQVIGNLGDDLITYKKKPRGTKLAELSEPPELMLVGAKNAEEMVNALKIVMSALTGGGKPPGEREFLGRKIFTVTSMAGPQLDPTNPKYRKMHLASSGGYVLIANDEAVLEEYLRAGEAQPKALREVPGLTEALQRVTGPGTSLVGYQNQVEMQRTTFELMKQNPDSGKESPVSGMTPVPESFGMAMPEQSLKEWVDYSLLPPFTDVEKYFHFTVYGGSANADGLTFKVFSPTPPGLK